MRCSSKHLLTALLVLGIVLTIVPMVKADIFTDVLDPFRGVDFGNLYGNFSMFIDGILYFIVLFGLAKFVFKEKFGVGGNLISIGMSLALAFAAAFFGSSNGFRLGTLGPYAILVVFLMAAFFLFNLLKNMGATKLLAFSVTFLVLSLLLQKIFLSTLLSKGSLLTSIFAILNIISIIGVIAGIISLFKGSGSGGGGNGGGSGGSGSAGGNGSIKDQQKAVDKEKKEAVKEEKNRAQQMQEMDQATKEIEELKEIADKIPTQVLKEEQDVYAQYEKLRQELSNIYQFVNQHLVPAVEKIEEMESALKKSDITDTNVIQQYTQNIANGKRYIQDAYTKLNAYIPQLIDEIVKLQQEVTALDKQIEQERSVGEARKKKEDLRAIDTAKQTTGLINRLVKLKNFSGNIFSNANKLLTNLQTIGSGLLTSAAYLPTGDQQRIEIALKAMTSKLNQYNIEVSRDLNEINALQNAVTDLQRDIKKDIDSILKVYDSDFSNIQKQEKMLKKMKNEAQDIKETLQKEIKPKNAKKLRSNIEDMVNKSNMEEVKLKDQMTLDQQTTQIMQNIASRDAKVAQLEKTLETFETRFAEKEKEVLKVEEEIVLLEGKYKEFFDRFVRRTDGRI